MFLPATYHECSAPWCKRNYWPTMLHIFLTRVQWEDNFVVQIFVDVSPLAVWAPALFIAFICGGGGVTNRSLPIPFYIEWALPFCLSVFVQFIFIWREELNFSSSFMRISEMIRKKLLNSSLRQAKVKVNLPLCLTKHHAMKTYWGVGV